METLIRLAVALGIFFVMIGWEWLSPRRQSSMARKKRWPVNLGLAGFNMVLMRFTIGSLAYLTAMMATQQSWGILNQFYINDTEKIIYSMLMLDFAIYLQHVLSHKWRILWQLHQVHHADMEIDATTAVRFHPLEIIISMLYKAACVVLIGAEPLAVLLFEMLLNGMATFNHSNVNIPVKLDRLIRGLIITPDMHRIHHSTVRSEMDSNYGFSISIWDRLFKTYTSEPSMASQVDMEIGLPNYRNQQQLGFFRMLALPFVIKSKNHQRSEKY